MTRWAILTGEYPPQPGGVSDYTQLVATELAAAGDSVRVYAPPHAGSGTARAGVEVVRLPDRFGPRSLALLDRLVSACPPDRILIQYVPHAFGWKGMNVPFAAWVAVRARAIAPVWVMFHEVAFPFAWRPAKYALLGGVTSGMARLLAGAAARVFVSIPAWGETLRRTCPRAKRAEWLPVPGVVGADASPEAVAAVRGGFAADVELVGHFGTFGDLIADVLEPAARDLLRRRPRARLLLIGRNSDQFLRRFADLAGRVSATGELSPDDVAARLRACDLLLQPYPDGISSRRTSTMAGLANGVPVVSNLGVLSEAVWSDGAVAAAPGPDPVGVAGLAAAFLSDPRALGDLGRRGAALYRDTFAVGHTISRLRTPDGPS